MILCAETMRQWGKYTVMYDSATVKVKELVVETGKSLSRQRHFKRNEHWHVVNGTGKVVIEFQETKKEIFLSADVNYTIPVGAWHKLTNTGNSQLKIIEIQYGESCEEEDIERLEI